MIKFVIAVHGTRGDVEPATAVALELQERGHVVTLGVPPNLVIFALTAGLLSVVAYGPDSSKQLEAELFRNLWKLQNPVKWLKQARALLMDGWEEMHETLFKISVSDVSAHGTV